MIKKSGRLSILLCLFLVISSEVILSVHSLAEAQSNKAVKSAIDQLRETLETSTETLRLSEKSSTTDLKTDVLENLNLIYGALTQVVNALDTIQTQQDKRIDSDHLYCTMRPGSEVTEPKVDACFRSSDPTTKIVTTIKGLKESGWHLTSLSSTAGPTLLAVYSKYIE